ncbi:MAG: hypothetical protein PHI72_07405 [Atribacterota bacterium]|nr:hypothetical protein [Atribacterota bacterium]MDD4895258.1 hypothetical protein [Atribacterota bacterium]MDD5637577.1 hypothetical protein [Atribacterota bacterium]
MLSETQNKIILTKIIATAGTILVWIPILLTVLSTITGTISNHMLRFDYLMPAELFPIAFIGTALLIWAALSVHLKQKNIAWGLGAAIFFLISAQTIAVLSGLASDSIKPVGWIWAIALTCIALYTLAIINIGLAGISLIREINFINKQ